MALFDFFYPSHQPLYYPASAPRYCRRAAPAPRAYGIADLSDLFEDELDYYVAPHHKPQAPRVPQVHLNEQKKGWIATLNLPGVRSFENINLDLEGETLHIRAQCGSSFQRHIYTHSLTLPTGADAEEINASFKNETLSILIPRLTQPVEQKPVEKTKESKEEKKEKYEQAKETASQNLTPAPQQNTLTKHLSSLFAMPRVNHRQTETHQVLAIELPEGWNVEKDLDLEVCNGVLNISMSKKGNGTSFSFRRSLALPAGATENNVTAKFENNTLEVSIPKPTPPKAFKIPVSIALPSTPSTPSLLIPAEESSSDSCTSTSESPSKSESQPSFESESTSTSEEQKEESEASVKSA